MRIPLGKWQQHNTNKCKTATTTNHTENQMERKEIASFRSSTMLQQAKVD